MAFGKSFKTMKEARAHLVKVKARAFTPKTFDIRRLSKKMFPRRKNLYHVGSYIDFINFA